MNGTFPSNGSMLNQGNVPTRIGTPSLLHAALPSENISVQQQLNPQESPFRSIKFSWLRSCPLM
ncbi:hypothetical protein BofuT4_uP007280.1 [Botrytis cinerea T4]|uniref:Uncharacterized protein n=1 Tax=Botryotinia fuckeliana (strain T4) TaxID=999810 RepID=G2XXH2_BOTF4|nr:hypothetical protein BofuT4_uP007280.1 [Botrytis cinerea T4]